MPVNELVLVVGLGEVGRPLLQILSRTYRAQGIDLEPQPVSAPCSALHICYICYPFEVSEFVGETVGYIRKYRPRLTIINSTVAVGTTRRVHEAAEGGLVAFSPVRGKHSRMEQDVLRYQKFVAGCTPEATEMAEQHWAGAGFRTALFRSPEIGELSKLLETTCLGVLVGWAQEIERLAEGYGGRFEEVNAFLQEIEFLPSHIFPGFIGGTSSCPTLPS